MSYSSRRGSTVTGSDSVAAVGDAVSRWRRSEPQTIRSIVTPRPSSSAAMARAWAWPVSDSRS
jgi:hypothetical protein